MEVVEIEITVAVDSHIQPYTGSFIVHHAIDAIGFPVAVGGICISKGLADKIFFSLAYLYGVNAGPGQRIRGIFFDRNIEMKRLSLQGFERYFLYKIKGIGVVKTIGLCMGQCGYENKG